MWVKNKGKKGGHMEWTLQCDKLVIELLANQVPPTSIQASILAMARSFFHEHDIVRELPCLKSIRNMRSTVLRVTKSLAAYVRLFNQKGTLLDLAGRKNGRKVLARSSGLPTNFTIRNWSAS